MKLWKSCTTANISEKSENFVEKLQYGSGRVGSPGKGRAPYTYLSRNRDLVLMNIITTVKTLHPPNIFYHFYSLLSNAHFEWRMPKLYSGGLCFKSIFSDA